LLLVLMSLIVLRMLYYKLRTLKSQLNISHRRQKWQILI
jgi:hypothetical protein